MNLHIATLGKEIGHIMSSFKEFKIDKLLLITSKDFEDKAKEVQKKVGFFNIITDIVYVNPFHSSSYVEIINGVFKYIKNQENKYDLFFNITGGTNLMSSAALTAAQFIGGSAYYVIKGEKKDEFFFVPIVKISLRDSMTEKQKNILNIIYREIKKNGKIKNLNKFSKDYGLYKQKLRFYIQQFEKLNLIKIDRSDREHSLELTETGKLIKQLI